MFRDGNNEALKLVMQGYSDSIKAKTSNQGTAMANAFNQGLSNAVQTHDNHEQAMQNREATRLQNEYMNRTMDDRVTHQAQQTKANDLANEYTERTMDDRVKHETQQTQMNANNIKQGQLYNDRLTLENQEQKLTSKSRVGATNAKNVNATAVANYDTTKTNTLHQNYQGVERPYEKNGKWYVLGYDAQGNKVNKEISASQAQSYKDLNARVEQNKRELRATETSANQQAISANQAQHAVNMNTMDTQNAAKQAYDETAQALTNSGMNRNEIATEINFAIKEGRPYIEVGGKKIDTGLAQRYLGYGLGSSGGGVGGGNIVNVNNTDRKTNAQYSADMIGMLKDPNATEEQKQKAREWFTANKDKVVEQARQKLVGAQNVAQSLQTLTGTDRVTKGMGYLTQYFGGDFAQAFGNLKASQSDALVTLATNSLKGSLTDRDMDIVKNLVPSMWQSNATNMGTALKAVDKMINELESYRGMYGDVYTPEQMKTIKNLQLFRDNLKNGMPSNLNF